MNPAFLATLTLLFSAAALAADKVVVLEVPSMNCAICPITVKKALHNVEGLSEVQVNYATKLVKVTYDDSATNTDALIRAATNAGYPAKVKKGNSDE
ncbi:MAG: mercury resistance system periplasmic binding protein MerP [Gammaproteobacteria bacterium]|nr:mercury resistance system periplasmic binding protein MerP [Gammaproteobacteria bacterium]